MRHGHEPPSTTGCSAPPGHWSLHVESALHDNEHDPVQRTVHVEPPAQFTLPLGPTVTSHSDMPLQLTLQDSPHVPVHVLSSVHASVQLPPLQPESPISQAALAGHEHDVPVQSGGGGPSPPHATANSEHAHHATTARARDFMVER